LSLALNYSGNKLIIVQKEAHMRTLKLGARLTGICVLGFFCVALVLEMTGSNREGIAGATGTAQVGNIDDALAVQGLSTLFRFNGVTDDGQQGSTNRKEATSIHCTNIDSSANVQLEVQLIQWNGIDVYTGTVSMPPNRSFTFSTQNTTIYFDDVILGGSPGTPAIFQGSGRVLSSSPNVICTAQILDPLNYPPVFMEKLPLHNADGSMVGDIHKLYLPLIRK
jgi:hypothetical protein